jgi:hypothetical protein
VVAVEIDRDLAAALARRFPGVKVVAGDARRVALPREPFKVVANLPFGGATAILTRFLDPDVPLQSADGRATSMPGVGRPLQHRRPRAGLESRATEAFNPVQ